ncbi:MAG TPA: LytR C-terminal domain-containing protein, partial [Candidatus Glassbacteria bacterium]|nr:LytR C-terminal domain-containing protein [Candidatus Glassbacteria bacterium]
HTDRPEIGRTVAQALGCSRLSAEPDNMALAHVTVILGQDWESFLADKQVAEPEPGKVRKLLGKVKKMFKID